MTDDRALTVVLEALARLPVVSASRFGDVMFRRSGKYTTEYETGSETELNVPVRLVYVSGVIVAPSDRYTGLVLTRLSDPASPALPLTTSLS